MSGSGDAFLHQQARTGATDLSLIEPDAIDQTLNRAVEIGVFEDDERRLASQLEREPLVAGRGRAADGASHFGRTGEGDLGHIGMFHQRFARRTVAGNDVDDARRQSDFRADLGKGQRGQRRELRGLEHHRVARGQRRRNLPGQHEQRKIPGNDLPNDAARGVSGKFLIEQLRPAGMVIEVASHQRNVNVPALANRFAVVHRLEHGQAAGMFLHGSRQRVEIACSRVRSERLPFEESSARRSNCCIDIGCRSLRNRGKFLAGGRICGFEVSAFGRLPPRAVNKMPEPAAVRIQPGQGLFGIFGRRTVFHADELLSDTHMSVITTLRQRMAIVRRITPGRMVFQLPFDVVQQPARSETE